jgi:cobalt-zinc-cadmium efflux system outer membrane protein
MKPYFFSFACALLLLSSISNAYSQAAPQQRDSTTPANPQAATGKRLRLEDLEQMALRRNPGLSQAAAGVRTAEALRRQAALYPNPMVGYTGEDINRGSVFNYGEHGVFAEQRLVTGGKLGIQRRLAEQDVAFAKAETDAERFRVLNTVRTLYYQALGEQRLLAVRTQLARLARRAVQTTSELANVGQADRPDLLAVEIEAQRLELGLVQSQNALQRTWRQLAAVIGNPQLEPVTLEGDLDALPKLDFETELARIFEQSPEVRAAEIGTARSELAVRQAQASVVPDIIVRGGMHYNRERLELAGRPVGWQASAEVGVQLPLFNRNQGNIAAAKAEAERATLAVERARLALRSRLASAFREYQDSLAAIERYKTQMIPNAQRAYDLYLTSFRQMAAAYPQVVITQRNLFQLQEDYVTTLVSAWQRAVEIQSLLLTAGTEASGHDSSGRLSFQMSAER